MKCQNSTEPSNHALHPASGAWSGAASTERRMYVGAIRRRYHLTVRSRQRLAAPLAGEREAVRPQQVPRRFDEVRPMRRG
jgi:hypothetical protein